MINERGIPAIIIQEDFYNDSKPLIEFLRDK